MCESETLRAQNADLSLELANEVAEVHRLRAKLETLLAALQPFATYSGEDGRKQPGILYEKDAGGQFCLPDSHGFHVWWSSPAGLAVNFTAGQFRRARNAWEQTK